jgi:hypothetical protein
MARIQRFDFEKFLQDHFGLVGPLHSELDCTDPAVWEEHDLEEFYTKEAWEAWERAINLFEDMARIGLISEETSMDIIHSFCDNA